MGRKLLSPPVTREELERAYEIIRDRNHTIKMLRAALYLVDCKLSQE